MYSKTLYDWLFHYNPFTHKWNAFRREDYSAYFNGEKKPISSKDLDTLVELIGRTDGDDKKISKLLNNDAY
jgi:hypothetical protein